MINKKEQMKICIAFMLLISIIIFSLHLIHAEQSTLGIFKSNNTINLKQIVSNTTFCNITSVLYPNSTQALGQVSMTKSGTEYNYIFTNSIPLGNYIVNGFCDVDGINTVWAYDFKVTGNGKNDTGSGVIVFFIIAFIILVGLSCYLSLYSIGHLMNKDFDIIDLAYDWGLFFVILALYFLENYYLGNLQIESYLIWFISAGGIMLVLVPFIAFILSLVNGSFSSSNYKFRVPKGRLR